MKYENVLKITQWGYGEGAQEVPLYVFTVPAKTMAGRSEIFRRTTSRREGYQRELSPGRLGTGKLGVAGYILNQMGVFPTSVLVNVRSEEGKIIFEKKNEISQHIKAGDLIVPENITWYVVDGQHRLEGLKRVIREKADLADYPVILTMTNEDIFYEMLIFYMVNSRQRSVPTGLAYRILQRMLYDRKAPKWIEESLLTGADRRKAVAATITDLLNQKSNSPFQGKIREIGEPKKAIHLTRDQTLTRYVAEVLREQIFEDMYDEDVADLLSNYWGAIKEIYPDCFDNSEEYAILDTLGLSSLSRLFPPIYGYCAKDGDISQERMKKYLGYLQTETPDHTDLDFQRPITERWWHKTDGPGIIHGTGEGHYKSVARNFAQKISLVIKKERMG